MSPTFSLITHDGKLRDLRMASEMCSSVSGAVAEVGVYRGGSLAMLAYLFPEKSVYGVDTFSGMPPVCEDDVHEEGDFSDVNYEEVNEKLSSLFQNVTLLKGFFPDDVIHRMPGEYSFVHVDCDIYQSVKDCCEFFWPRLSSGGMMLFDDPGFLTCPGAAKAFNEFDFNSGEILEKGRGISWVVRKN